MTPRPELLLHPNIPKPMHGLAPRVILGEDWWNIERQKAYKKTDYRCAACGVYKTTAKYHQWLEAHEFYKIDYEAGRMEMIEIAALCHSCHNYIHSGRLKALFDAEKIDEAKYYAIINHGDGIIAKAGLIRPDDPISFVEWSDWRLILEGKEYASLWKNHADWEKHYFPLDE